MRILVLGAGAVGGYFGGRLAQAGADVTFLVRDRRGRQLDRDGLVVESPHGDFRLPVKWIDPRRLEPDYDLALLTCKAYDLDAAIVALRPGIGAGTLVVPLLNGLAHLDRLDAEFGPARVTGGACYLAGTLTPDGVVKQLTPLHRIVFGIREGNPGAAARTLARLEEAFQRTPVDAALADNVLLEMWEKYVLLASLAGMTCLMRGSVGDIVAADDGARLMEEMIAACEETARRSGYEPRPDRIAAVRRMLGERGSLFTASMLRDIEAGQRTEGEHVVGDMLRRARAAGVESPVLTIANAHLQAYAMRREREALAREAT